MNEFNMIVCCTHHAKVLEACETQFQHRCMKVLLQKRHGAVSGGKEDLAVLQLQMSDVGKVILTLIRVLRQKRWLD